MSPLTSIRQLMTPDLRGINALKAGEASPAKTITAAELQSLHGGDQLSAPCTTKETSFGSVLGQMVQEVNAKQEVSKEMVAGMLSGQPVGLHQAMLSMEEASVSFQLMVEVRNKLLESYQELMRMQV